MSDHRDLSTATELATDCPIGLWTPPQVEIPIPERRSLYRNQIRPRDLLPAVPCHLPGASWDKRSVDSVSLACRSGSYLLLIFTLLPTQRTDELLSSPTALPSPCDPITLSRTLLLLLQLFYDLNSQDLPEFFEDNIEPFMALLHKYLTWTRPELVSDDEDDEEAGPLEKIRASICEIAELYTQRYLDAFTMMEKFVETTWTLVTSLGSSVKYDIVRFQQCAPLGPLGFWSMGTDKHVLCSSSARRSPSSRSPSACPARRACSKDPAFWRLSARRSCSRIWC